MIKFVGAMATGTAALAAVLYITLRSKDERSGVLQLVGGERYDREELARLPLYCAA